MPIPTTDKLLRPGDMGRLGERDIARQRTPASPASDILSELRAIHALLERQQKPFNVQKAGLNTNRFVGLPVIPTQAGALILDHDDDRDLIILVNPTAGQLGAYKWDDGNFIDNNTQLGGILVPNVPVVFGPHGAPSQRLFAASLTGSLIDLFVTVVRIDRFPVSTR